MQYKVLDFNLNTMYSIVMSCYHPRRAFRRSQGPDPSTGKWPLTFQISDGLIDDKHVIMVPCNKCIGCRMDRAREWAVRCVHEAKMHDENCFLTLTYNEENIERCRKGFTEEWRGRVYVREDEGIYKRDFVNFMKTLRKMVDKKYGKKIRFYHCAEYGDRFQRPHHHVCIFGYMPEDKEPYTFKDGITLYKSKEISEEWPYGIHTISDVTAESAAYCAQYLNKKIMHRLRNIHYGDVVPPYQTMSRRPGIGATYLKKYESDVYNYDMIVIDGMIKCKPPRYYDNKYELSDKMRLESLKIGRMNKINKEENTAKRLRVREELLEYKMKNKERKMVVI